MSPGNRNSDVAQEPELDKGTARGDAKFHRHCQGRWRSARSWVRPEVVEEVHGRECVRGLAGPGTARSLGEHQGRLPVGGRSGGGADRAPAAGRADVERGADCPRRAHRQVVDTDVGDRPAIVGADCQVRDKPRSGKPTGAAITDLMPSPAAAWANNGQRPVSSWSPAHKGSRSTTPVRTGLARSPPRLPRRPARCHPMPTSVPHYGYLLAGRWLR